MEEELLQYVDDRFCYLSTVGRVSSRPHEIEIWFALSGRTLYMLAGGRYDSDWVKNIERNPSVTVRIKDRTFAGQGRVVDESSAEAVRARELVGQKYGEWQPGEPLAGWTWEALPVALDVESR